VNEARLETPNARKLYRIVAVLFDLDPDVVDDHTAQSNVGNWDSMGTVSLVAELEAAFDIEFDLMDLAAFRSVGEIRKTLAERGIEF